jgi:hypothetical protein
MKLSKDDVLKIQAGRSKAFQLDSGSACNAAKVCLQYVKRTCMPENISDYKSTIDWDSHIMTITAIGK